MGLTIQERTAWVHRAAAAIPVDGSLYQLKMETKALIAEANLLLDAIRAEEARQGIERTMGKATAGE